LDETDIKTSSLGDITTKEEDDADNADNAPKRVSLKEVSIDNQSESSFTSGHEANSPLAKITYI